MFHNGRSVLRPYKMPYFSLMTFDNLLLEKTTAHKSCEPLKEA